MTKLLVPKSEWVWKKLGGWCCGSCQALLNVRCTLGGFCFVLVFVPFTSHMENQALCVKCAQAKEKNPVLGVNRFQKAVGRSGYFFSHCYTNVQIWWHITDWSMETIKWQRLHAVLKQWPNFIPAKCNGRLTVWAHVAFVVSVKFHFL